MGVLDIGGLTGVRVVTVRSSSRRGGISGLAAGGATLHSIWRHELRCCCVMGRLILVFMLAKDVAGCPTFGEIRRCLGESCELVGGHWPLNFVSTYCVVCIILIIECS